jgi:hypothetical protein
MNSANSRKLELMGILFDYFFKAGVIVIIGLGKMLFNQMDENRRTLSAQAVAIKSLEVKLRDMPPKELVQSVIDIRAGLKEIDTQVQKMAREYAVLRYKVFNEPP